MKITDRVDKLKRALEERILVVDGATGTFIQDMNLSADDFGGAQYEGCNEYLNLTNPDAIRFIHRQYIEAGADILETNSFGSTPLVLGEYGLGEKAYEISKAAAQLAREVAGEYESPGKTVFVAGSMGPTTKAISVTGGVTWDELAGHYYIQAKGLMDGGADILLLETSQDTLNVKAGLAGIDRLSEEMGFEIPVAVQCTIEAMGTMLGGQDIEAFYSSLAHRNLLWIGMNCATGPAFMRDHLRTLSGLSRFPVAVIPNAGLPDEDGNYNEIPSTFSATVGGFCEAGWTNVIGGCCGTTPEHIRQLVNAASGLEPRKAVSRSETFVSGLEAFVIDDDTRPVLVGERTNVLGSRQFKRLVAESKWEEMAEIGRHQVRGGAQILDVCLQDPDRDELSDVINFLGALTKKIKVSIMLDTTDAKVLAEALKLTPGKCVINSINLEDGEERFRVVVPLAKRFGAALVVGCIDEDKTQAQAVTRQRKLEIAQRSYKLLTEEYGVLPEDIIFDPLVFPIATGDENYIGAGVETIEGIRLIKEHLPLSKTVLGISNVSFGLPQAGREVLNSVFLYHCVQAGLDMAIVNSQIVRRYASTSQEERDLAEDLIWWRGADPIGAFADHFRGKKVERTKEDRAALPLDQRISSCVIEGTKEGLLADLDEALKDRTAMEIINGPLLSGMDEVGRLFAANELIVAEVLSSAESMKAAVSHLEPHMDSSENVSRGTIILATVKGDVHDIGKNLVDIILANNGYRVVNLGIKVPPQDLIAAFKENKPDIIGLSGLLVKSAQMMVETARDLSNAGIDAPILVGGAALSNKFTRTRIAPEYGGLVAYAQDAMDGLRLAHQICDPELREALIVKVEAESLAMVSEDETRRASVSRVATEQVMVSTVTPVDKPPTPPDLRHHVITDYDLSEVFAKINPVMLYTRHLGYRGRFEESLLAGEPKAVELRSRVQEVEDIMIARDDIGARAVYSFFRAASDGDDITVLSPEGKQVMERFQFGRQQSGEGLCLSDYVLEASSPNSDYLCCFVTSVGPGVRALADEWMASGDYLNAHILQVLALEGAEAMAEILHQRIRSMWGFPDPADISNQDLFKTNYGGRRYSFGYPACPRLEDQEQLWRLIEPDKRLNITLTEGFMMDPEASVSAIVFHHAQAKYFNLSSSDIEVLEAKLTHKNPTG
ncbi:MAG: methionine synthase [Chloroflexi bacterium]|nr:methionine synthase [Chloroflexota bacterium]